MIDVKTAVQSAMNFLNDFHEFVPTKEMRLEETEHGKTGEWFITLSTVDTSPSSVFGKRVYKIFRIDGKTGDVKSMKVRTLEPVE